MREIKFRGKRKDNSEWIYGYYVFTYNACYIINNEHILVDEDNASEHFIEVVPETVGQFTGLKDKNGNDIYEGDEILYRVPYRTTQTHTGDNIPNGSYTEPMEPGIKEKGGVVVFAHTTFYVEEENDYDFKHPLQWCHTEWDLGNIEEAISYGRPGADIFDDPEEGDLQYLITEVAKVENAEKLIEYLSGIEIVGNIHD